MKHNLTGCLLFMITSLFLCKKSTAQVNTDLSNLVAPTKVNVNLLPMGDNIKSLGSDAKSWKDFYLDGILWKGGFNWVAGSGLSGNTLLGPSAGFNLISSGALSQNNTAVGFNAGFNTTTGTANTFLGATSGQYNTTGGSNTFVGSDAGRDNTTGYANTFLGIAAGTRNLGGRYNIAIGRVAGGFNKDGNSNTWIGNEAGYLNSVGNYNTMIGDSAGRSSTASYNTMVGEKSGTNTTTGTVNDFFGYHAGINNTTGSYNAAIGSYALDDNAGSTGNTALGYSTGTLFTNGNFNTFIGYDADASAASLTNSIAVGYSSRVTASNQVRIGNSSISSIGGFEDWSNISDGRYKRNIKENVPGLSFINKLKPVTYNLNITGIENHLNGKSAAKGNAEPATSSTSEAIAAKERSVITGFVAQDVEKAAKELGYEFSGVDAPKNDNDLYGLRYAEFVVPLVKAVQELSKMNNEKDELIAKQQQMLSEVTERLNAIEKRIGIADQSSAIDAISSDPGVSSLAQNAPNPFSKNAVIRYNLAAGSTNAQLIITNAKGQVMNTFSLSGKGVGQLTIEAGSLAAGNYFYTLVVDRKKIETRQMTIIN